MLWSCISFQGEGSLHCIRGRLNSEDYQQILGDVMLPDARCLVGEDFIFQQDNATIHTLRSTRQWLRDNEVTVLDWPAKSPDANPIENLWHVLKVRANEKHPETEQELWEAVQMAWHEILQGLINNLIEIVPRRIEAIRRARGGATKY